MEARAVMGASLLLLLLAACGGEEGGGLGTPAVRNGSPPAASSGTQPPEGAVAIEVAMDHLALSRGVLSEEIEVVSADARQWPDACLGLAGPNEICAQAITPGYEVVLRLGQDTFTYRTDERGRAVRPEDSAGRG